MEFEVKKLQEFLTELQGMEVLPLPGSSTDLDHHAWLQRHARIVKLLEKAVFVALLTVPPEIEVLLAQIDERKDQLFQIGEYRPKLEGE